MLADALTKDKGDAADLLRAVIRSGKYQISDEEAVLQMKAEERERRRERGEVRDAKNKAHGLKFIKGEHVGDAHDSVCKEEQMPLLQVPPGLQQNDTFQ
jgi:hypothetical protein